MAATVRSWSVADAKARLSEVMECAQTEGPQTITRRGRAAVVVVSAEEWERKTARTGTLLEFLQSSPLADPEVRLDLERDKFAVRDIDL